MLGLEKRIKAMYDRDIDGGGPLDPVEESRVIGRGATWLAVAAIVIAIFGMVLVEARSASRVAVLENRLDAMEEARLAGIESRLAGIESVAGGIRTMVLSSAVQEMTNKAELAALHATTPEQKEALAKIQELLATMSAKKAQ